MYIVTCLKNKTFGYPITQQVSINRSTLFLITVRREQIHGKKLWTFSAILWCPCGHYKRLNICNNRSTRAATINYKSWCCWTFVVHRCRGKDQYYRCRNNTQLVVMGLMHVLNNLWLRNTNTSLLYGSLQEIWAHCIEKNSRKWPETERKCYTNLNSIVHCLIQDPSLQKRVIPVKYDASLHKKDVSTCLVSSN